MNFFKYRILPFLQQYTTVLIVLFPLFYFFAGLYIRLILDDPSLLSIDPEYAYFISGLNISEGIFKLTHIDHPGTPLQYLIAFVIKIVNLFRENPDTTTDALANSDLYLTIVNITVTGIVATTLFIAGILVYRKTRSVLFAMLIQTVPFANYVWYELIARIASETLMPVPILAIIVFIVCYLYSEKENIEVTHLVLMSIIVAFALSLKINMVALLVFPLLIIKPWKQKLLAVSLVIVFFFMLSIPVTLQTDRFYHWTKNLLMHSGYYGGGEKNIVDPDLFRENIQKIMLLQKSFSYLTGILLIVSIASYAWFKNRMNIRLRKTFRVTWALLLFVLVQVIVVGKHYSPRYFLPAVMMTPLVVFLIIRIIQELKSTRILNVISLILLTVFLAWHFNQQLITIKYSSGHFQNQVEARNETKGIANTFGKDSMKIIVTQDYGSPFVEYALHFGTVWSAAAARERYREILGELFPNTYQYTTWDGNFIYWADAFDPVKIINERVPVYMYLENNSEELYRKAMEKVFPDNEVYSVEASRLFFNSVNGEVIYKINLLHK